MKILDVKEIAEMDPEEGVYLVTHFLAGEGDEDEWENSEKKIGTTLNDPKLEETITEMIANMKNAPYYNKPGSKLSFTLEERKTKRVHLTIGKPVVLMK
jgi:hypothetical protein